MVMVTMMKVMTVMKVMRVMKMINMTRMCILIRYLGADVKEIGACTLEEWDV